MISLKTKRTHDKFYLDEDRRNNPKEYFKFIIDNIQLDLNNLKIIDIGCATGDFLFYINSLFPKANIFAADIDKELLSEAKKNVPSIKECFQLDISNLETFEKFDAIFMLGVHSIFDDLKWINSIKLMLKNENSKAYIFGIFNPDKIDVIIRGRESNSNQDWETGWNVFSKESIRNAMDECGLKHKFIDFNLKIDIDKKNEDSFRSWTIPIQDKQKLVINGLCLVHYFSLCEVSLIET